MCSDVALTDFFLRVFKSTRDSEEQAVGTHRQIQRGFWGYSNQSKKK
jgi:hypothetical protein